VKTVFIIGVGFVFLEISIVAQENKFFFRIFIGKFDSITQVLIHKQLRFFWLRFILIIRKRFIVFDRNLMHICYS